MVSVTSDCIYQNELGIHYIYNLISSIMDRGYDCSLSTTTLKPTIGDSNESHDTTRKTRRQTW